ncbi:hypothetical protein E3P90_04146, partial [Wallemia ichthyophaga]
MSSGGNKISCPACQIAYRDILDHFRKKHRGVISKQHAARVKLGRCDCGAVLASNSSVALRSHQNKARNNCTVWLQSHSPNPQPDFGVDQCDTRTSSHRPTPASVLDIFSSNSPPPATRSPPPPPALPTTPEWPAQDCTTQFLKLSGCSGVNKPPSPIWAPTFKSVVERLSKEYVGNPSEANLFHMLALPKLGLASCQYQAASGNKQARTLFSQYPHTGFGPVPLKFNNRDRSMMQTVEGYVEQGRCGTGNAVLGSNTKVLPIDDAVINALRAKHPQGESEPFQRYEGFVPGSMPHSGLAEHLLQKKMSADTSPGVSGWTYDLTMLAFQVPTFTAFFNLLMKQVIQNNAPGKTMLCASKLIPLSKPDNGVRPIAVGELFYRLIMKTIMSTYFNIGCLLPNQLGVGSKGGVEPIIYAAQRETDRESGSQFSHLISLDFSNAFNTLKRSSLCNSVFRHLQPVFRSVKWAYNQPAPLVLNDGDQIVNIPSNQGVRQGDPLGPLLFSLGVKDILQDLQNQLEGRATIMAYLDDVYLFAKEDVMDEVEEFFRSTSVGLKLNRSKCSVWRMDEIRENGCSILGSFVGSKKKRAAFLRAKIAKVVSKLDLLQGLRSQHALLLLTRCIQSELRHLQRCLRSDDMMEEWVTLDTALIRQVQLLRGSSRELLSDEWIISLPVRYGGMGISMHSKIAPLAYSAMADFTQDMLRPIFDTVYEPGNDNVAQPERQHQRVSKIHEEQYKKHVDLTREQQNILIDSQSKFGKSWLTTIPYNNSLALSNSEVSVALHYRTLCPGQAEFCLACGLRNTIGHDDL